MPREKTRQRLRAVGGVSSVCRIAVSAWLAVLPRPMAHKTHRQRLEEEEGSDRQAGRQAGRQAQKGELELMRVHRVN